ncbi:S8 family serine peptidase [Neobacillus sp. PS3-34]|uniref:S8 family serine peptidase n=1 Tax=Neobacillus sp. PS3-34 TaxID=3070678 RepID=UPI0027E077D3|nr:S8 family serine peptidase [Neobacillus sp. PS3-34]WML46657.1 S8 family serine peptidase [Neobacillus sp. PS3-34]
MIKKSFASLLIFLLMFSSVAFGATVPTQPQVHAKREIQKFVPNPTAQYKPLDKVRVVVELTDKPTIEYAQSQGKKYSDLSVSTRKSLEANASAKQDQVVSDLKSTKMKVLNKFTTVVNGFSAEVNYGSIAEIVKNQSVSKVTITNEYERPTEKPEMIYSKELVQAQKAWDSYGYKGEGMVVGIIDTGIDSTHRDMILTDASKAKLNEASIKQIVDANGLQGKFYTDKVPYGYNYIDHNDTIIDVSSEASMHGMHVSGTVAANGDESNGGIKGIAPEAQLLALKVFSNDPEMRSTFTDVLVKAIDDGVKLGADVLNMSLGSTAGFVAADDPEQMAVQRATDNGVVMSISAGNSAHFGHGYAYANPYASNPDIGVSGAPGLAKNSIQVASFENSFMDLPAVTATVDGTGTKYPFMSASSVDPGNVETKTFDILDAGEGQVSEFAGKDFKGKYALIKRGTIGFVDKALNAQAAGAVGAIIYNNADGFVSMATDAAIQIPQLFLLKTDGDALKAALTAGKAVKIAFNGDKVKTANPSANKMSDFTSWGLTPDLDFKPELTAPGGQIYSTFNNNTYGMMSGTSMAAPHVSGGSALVLERVDKEFHLTNLARVKMAKNILMNTAKVLEDQGAVGFGVPYSPRRQGAGLMQLHSALSTPVVVTEQQSGDAKVALKQISGDHATFTLVAKNYSNEAANYDVNVNAQTTLALFGEQGYAANDIESQPLENVGIKINGQDTASVQLSAGEEKTITVDLDLSQAQVYDVVNKKLVTVPAEQVFTNGYFAEGFVTLTDPTDTNPELHVPYVGFKGEWDKAPIVDAPVWDGNTFYGLTGLLDEQYNFLGWDIKNGGVNPDNIAFSPNGDGVQDQVVPLLSFLRNAKSVEFNILDKDGNKLRTLRTENLVRKNYYDGGAGSMYSLRSERAWDGKVNLKDLPEGSYQYEVRAVIDYPGAKWQSFKFPVKIDNTAPTFAAALDSATKTISFTNVADNEGGSGIAYYDVLVNGESVFPKGEDKLTGTATDFKLADFDPTSEVVVKVYDYAGNSKSVTVQASTETTAPDVHVLTPDAYGVVDTKDVKVSGYINEVTSVKELTIAGQQVTPVYNPDTKQYDFSTVLHYNNDGVYNYAINVVDANGNKASFERTVLVDTTAPGLKINVVPATVSQATDKVTVSLDVADNFDELRTYVNGNEVYFHEFMEPYEMRAFKHTITTDLNLKLGENQFVVEVTDLAGNKTTQTLTVTRLTDTPNPGGGTVPGPTPTPTPDPTPTPTPTPVPVPTPTPTPEPTPEPEPTPAPAAKVYWKGTELKRARLV